MYGYDQYQDGKSLYGDGGCAKQDKPCLSRNANLAYNKYYKYSGSTFFKQKLPLVVCIRNYCMTSYTINHCNLICEIATLFLVKSNFLPYKYFGHIFDNLKVTTNVMLHLMILLVVPFKAKSQTRLFQLFHICRLTKFHF